MTHSSDVVWHSGEIQRAHREQQHGHRGAILWFTGLSGAGKSTLARAVEAQLYQRDVHTYVLDGDNVRHGLCGDLGFSVADREENIRRIGEVAKLFVDAGILVLTAFISPFTNDRERARNLVTPGDFIEVHCDCALDICESRDVKGLYQRARRGEINHFTGISSPYEVPMHPELRLDTGHLDLDMCVQQVLTLLQQREILFTPPAT